MPSFIVFDPTVSATQEESSTAPRLTNFEGLTIGILDNTKGPANAILSRVAELMQQRLGAGEVVYHRKPTFGRVAAQEVVDDMVARCDLVLTALGDRGSCSSCSMHDAITFDRRGIPAVAVLSEPFTNTGRMMARTHKLPDYRFAIIPHPVGMRPEEIEANAERVYAQVLPILKGQSG